MKKKWSTLLVAILCLTMSVWALAGCGGSSSDGEEAAAEPAASGDAYTASEVTSEDFMAEDVKAFYDNIDMEYAYNLSEELAYNWDDYAEWLGWRTAGSDAEHATADFLAAEMEKIGLQDVEKVGTACDKFQFNKSSLKIADTDIDFSKGTQKACENGMAAPASYQVNGTDGDMTAEIVNCGWGFESDYEGKDVEGKIVLVQVDQSNESWIDGVMRQGKEAGVGAMVTWSNSGYGEAGDFTVNVQDVCCGDYFPTVAISAKQAKMIKKAIKEGHNECTLNVDAEMVNNGGTTYNVIGKIPGKNHDQKIMVAGHYDKYWYGFQDDCAAMGMVYTVAKAMLDAGYEPENDIYFVCHGAEEWGASDSMYDWTTGAWGMVDDENFGEGTIAMLNCELPAFEMNVPLSLACVPEFSTLVKDMFDKGLIITEGEESFSLDSVATSTMEDGISYREHGVPYLLNAFEGSSFMCDNYHTIADDKSTYSEDVFKTNIDWYGAYAIYLDAMPALELDLTQSAKQLKDDFNADYAKEAGIDVKEYNAALKDLSAAAKANNEKIAACNEAYTKAIADEDAEAVEAARAEGVEINKTSLAAFKMINEDFLKVTDFTTDYGHTPENSNMELIDGVLAGIEKGELWAEDEASGAADCAWNVNTVLDYNAMIFSKDVAQNELDAHTPGYYTEGKDQAQWGWNHMFNIADTAEGAYILTHAETMDDIEDIDAVKAIYEAAREDMLLAIANDSIREITQMGQIANILK
ncbi:MAG: M28 family peptidase [Clostridia bacterium]|nr:M28 family peptidase [Clostridia bacterium]